MKIAVVFLAACLSGCASHLPYSDDQLLREAVTVGADESILFRGPGSIRLNDMNSRGGVFSAGEVIVTNKQVFEMGFDHKNRRPLMAASLDLASIHRVSDSHWSFVMLEMRDGVTHWVDIGGGRKREFIAALGGAK